MNPADRNKWEENDKLGKDFRNVQPESFLSLCSSPPPPLVVNTHQSLSVWFFRIQSLCKGCI